MPDRNNLCTIIFSLLVTLVLTGCMYVWFIFKRRNYLRMKQLKREIVTRDLQLERLNREKEWLLQEIHHRVKNNLQIVLSLLNSQLAYLHNADALDAVRKSQHRMYAISLIHQKQYQSDSLAEIDMKWYIEALVDYISDCFSTSGMISFILKTDAVKLDVTQAVPLGLILNEVISNAIQFAFPHDTPGTIEISFEAAGAGVYQLKIRDNGIGLPDSFEKRDKHTLGMSLIRGLTEQLGGKIRMQNASGLCVDISFQRHDHVLNKDRII